MLRCVGLWPTPANARGAHVAEHTGNQGSYLLFAEGDKRIGLWPFAAKGGLGSDLLFAEGGLGSV